MEVAVFIREARRLPDEKLLQLAAEIDAVAAETVDKKLERAVEAGFFDAMAAAALREDAEGKTCELDEILGHNGVS